MDRNAVRAAWDRVSETYAANRNPDGNDAALIDELLADLPADARVLDVGCGDGMRTLANLPPDAVGLDLSRRGLELASGNVPNPLVQGDMVQLPFADDSFDGITAYHAVFHVERATHPAVYREFARVLKPGGRVLTTVGQGAYQSTRKDWLRSGESMFFSTPGRDRTAAQLEEAGFDVVEARSVDDPLGSSALFFVAEKR
ncbi:class I SAM-dependent methyltransferase [Salinirubellus salinus]|jgi:ubiquinone/menaquinone biosynthesis C-methylase UbiE|uniref:Class I SAM-dependent methyltransferase n=1 Tax=Salinirubellus salinus TaxID=1364945 RepID=A0A9E7R1H8_9EURY|nr:class I SAM-dependent methyltransferase [Salinirubellus salinus]UWM53153.1 class I SAM-dependent methyltransferase [Salinirubellus salinus]